MLLVNFAIQGNGEEREVKIQHEKYYRLWLHTISLGPVLHLRKKNVSQCHVVEKAEQRHRSCSAEARLFLAVLCLSRHWLCWSSWLWVQWLRLLSAWKEVLCQAVLEANRAVLVHSCLWANRILESAWLYWELTFPGLNWNTSHNVLVSMQKRTVLLLE